MSNLPSPLRLIKSFVRRDSRMTDAQTRAFEKNFATYSLPNDQGLLDLRQYFQRDATRILEIGFGNGLSLAAIAAQNPAKDFIGIETHKPGVGNVLSQIESLKLSNIRIFYGDAVDILKNCIPDQSLMGVQIFFPDPWPKRRHHKRRLIQQSFIELLISKLQPFAALHLATDWHDYAKHMMRVLSDIPQLNNLAGNAQFAPRSLQRPVVTKFEQRGLNEGRQIWELLFALSG